MKPIAFSDAELDMLLTLAQPLPPENRTRFLEAIAAELAAQGAELGPGSVHRIARELQKRFFTPSLGPIPRSRAWWS
jgi:hypothetical protein